MRRLQFLHIALFPAKNAGVAQVLSVRKIGLLLLTIFFFTTSYAQKEGYNWFFGQNSGMTWNTTQSITLDDKNLVGLPTPLSGGVTNQMEGIFCMSDGSGNLLFYSDGVTIWNRKHQQMVNGEGLFGHNSSAQSGIVVPFPDQAGKYIVLSISLNCDFLNDGHIPNRIAYSIIDMSLNSGDGEVIIKNEVLTGATGVLGECIAAVKNTNGTDYWIIAVGKGAGPESAINVWEITASGVQTECINSYTLPANTSPIASANGYLRFSVDGTRFAWPVRYSDVATTTTDCFFGSFNPTTGIFSNVRNLNLPYVGSGVEFSLSGEIIYTAVGNDGVRAYMFSDLLNAQDPNTVIPRTIGAGNTLYALQMGPDGRIYSTLGSGTNMGVFDNVEDYNNSTYHIVSGLVPSTSTVRFGLPNIMAQLLHPLDPGIIGSDTAICTNSLPITLKTVTDAVASTGIFAYNWVQSVDNGLTWTNAPDVRDQNTYTTPILTETTMFRRDVTSTSITGFTYQRESNEVTISVSSPIFPGSIGSDQTICSGTMPTTLISESAASGGTGTLSYRWQSSTDSASFTNIGGVDGTEASYSPGALMGTAYFRRNAVGTDCDGNDVSISSNVIKITIAPPLTAGSISSKQTICSGERPETLTSISEARGGIEMILYLWQQSATGVSDWNTASGIVDQATYSPPELATTTYYRRSAISDCSGNVFSNVIEIIVADPVYTDPVIIDIESEGTEIITCIDETLTLFAALVSSGSITNPIYKWYDEAIDGTMINEGPTFTTSALTADTIFYVTVEGEDYCEGSRLPIYIKVETCTAPVIIQKDATLLITPDLKHNGSYPNPISVLYNERIKYEISATNTGTSSRTITVTDTIPVYLEYVSGSATGNPTSNMSIDDSRLIADNSLKWTFTNVLPSEKRTAVFETTPVSGAVASQPLFINSAWVEMSGYAKKMLTNSTYHQGGGISITTFSAGYGGNIYNAGDQALDYMTTPRSGIIITPDYGYKFAGWSHNDYTTLRGKTIKAQRDIAHYDTLTIYGDVELRANFSAEEYPIHYRLNGGRNAPDNPSVYTIESRAITLESPEKEGDVFVGWTGSNGDDPQSVVKIPAGSTGELEFYANFMYSNREDGKEHDDAIKEDKVWVIKDDLYLQTHKPGSIVRIHTLDGILREQRTIVAPGVSTIKLLPGLYVVNINNGIAQKVRIQ